MPADMEFTAEDSSYTSSETGIKVRVGSAVRLRVIGASMVGSNPCAIASMNEPCLGLLA